MRADFQPVWVLGTDTEIGKTLASALIQHALEASYWKPVQSGSDNGVTDTMRVKSLSQRPDESFLPERWHLTEPFSPHKSAKIDGVRIRLADFSWPECRDTYLVAEGAGGLLVPLNDKDLLIDLVAQLSAPVILVCRSSLGTINHTLLSVEALRSRNIPIIGFIMSGRRDADNKQAIEHFSGLECLAEIPYLDDINPRVIKELAINTKIAAKIKGRLTEMHF
ncbi:MAG: dethiobiotin synthase [Balneolales bacterium]|nr:dethiobiotin synthase [Balneolales bacterium]